MIHPDTKQAFELSDYFHELGNALGEYIQANKAILADDERNELFDNQVALLQMSGKINMMGVTLVFEDVQESLTQLNTITAAVVKTVRKALAVQDAINVAAALVSIGTAIISKNPQLFTKSAGKLGDTLKGMKNKKI